MTDGDNLDTKTHTNRPSTVFSSFGPSRVPMTAFVFFDFFFLLFFASTRVKPSSVSSRHQCPINGVQSTRGFNKWDITKKQHAGRVKIKEKGEGTGWEFETNAETNTCEKFASKIGKADKFEFRELQL